MPYLPTENNDIGLDSHVHYTQEHCYYMRNTILCNLSLLIAENLFLQPKQCIVTFEVDCIATADWAETADGSEVSKTKPADAEITREYGVLFSVQKGYPFVLDATMSSKYHAPWSIHFGHLRTQKPGS